MSTAIPKEKVHELGTQVKKVADDAKSAVSSLTDKAKDASCYMADKAEAATEAVGAGMESFGHTIRDHAPRSGVLGNAGDAIADKLENSGRYLEDKGMKGVGEDLTKLIRNNPVPALLVGIGFGFVLARILRS